MNKQEARDRRGYQKHPADTHEAELWDREAVWQHEPTNRSATSEEKARILTQLQGNSRASAFEAAKWAWQHPDPDLAPPLVDLLSEGRGPFNRAAAAYALQAFMNPRAVPALERVVADQLENPVVRGYAAETLAHFHRRKSHKIQIHSLQDRSKIVRFWCAFALGEMSDRAAASILQKLAESDRRMVPGFHTVAEEAEDALRRIGNRRWHRCPYCVGRRGK